MIEIIGITIGILGLIGTILWGVRSKRVTNAFERYISLEQELEGAREELSEYQCPFCGAPLIGRDAVILSDDADGLGEVFECGYAALDSQTQRPCPLDPLFPTLEDYEFEFVNHSEAPIEAQWFCYVKPKTRMASSLHLERGFGRTEEEAKQMIIENYRRKAEKWRE